MHGPLCLCPGAAPDDPLNRELLGDWLEAEGFEVILADTPEAGFVNIAAEPSPSAMLLDAHLGAKNGLTLAHWARRRKHLAHVPLVAVTARVSAKEKKSVLDAGYDGCITRPIDFRALRELLGTLLVRPRV